MVAIASSPAFGDIDLLTVVMHEFGHVLGFDDLMSARGEDSLMGGTLETGTRYLFANGHNGNGNGTSRPQVQSAQGALVAMEERFDSLFAKRKVNQNSWLTGYLVNGAQDSFKSFGINGDIQILLDPKSSENNKGTSRGL